MRTVANSSEVLADFHLAKDLLYERMNIPDARTRELFEALYHVCVEQTPPVDLLVCLSAPNDLIIDRIRARQRDFEQQLDPDYYVRLNRLYEEHFQSHTGAKLLVRMDQFDFCKSPALFEELSTRIDRETRWQTCQMTTLNSAGTSRELPSASGLDRDYFRPRDFEYVQPLYDLAFLLEVAALASGTEVPKYRTFSLWRAGYSLDGGTMIDKWLDAAASDADLGYVPSSRILQYVTSVRDTGTLPELRPFSSERYRRALRLRSVRGLGPSTIAATLSSSEPAEDWLEEVAIDIALDKDRIAQLYANSQSWTLADGTRRSSVTPPVALHRASE